MYPIINCQKQFKFVHIVCFIHFIFSCHIQFMNSSSIYYATPITSSTMLTPAAKKFNVR